MEELKIKDESVTLVDQVEDKLFRYISNNNMKVGDSIPKENELAEALGVSRSVLREALSRLRMLGVIESRTRRGMVLSEPDIFGGLQRIIDPMILGTKPILDLLEFRVALEIGISDLIYENATGEDIEDLEDIVERGAAEYLNFYKAESEYEFHTKLYEITGNGSVKQFQEIMYPVSIFVRNKFKDYFKPINEELLAEGLLVTHKDLIDALKNGTKDDFRKAVENSFETYKRFLRENRNGAVDHD